MPLLGLGVYDMYGKQAIDAISYALDVGYRLIDTASMYENEREVGQSIKNSGLARSDIFVTTKVNNNEQGYDHTLKAYDKSLDKLQTDYVDLYLIHWPLRNTRKETWKALEYLYSQGRVKAIGVANYSEPFLDELETYAEIVPVLNQVEFSPFLYLENLLERCRAANIQLQSYTPLVRGEKLEHPVLKSIANAYDKTTAQVILRWNIQHGISTIPKSSNRSRISENFDIWDFSLSMEEMDKINALNQNYRVVDDPLDYF